MNDNVLDWKVSVVEGQNVYTVVDGTNSCYTITPKVNPGSNQPFGHYFAGWASPFEGSPKRYRIDGNAVTAEECKTICQAHIDHVRRSNI